MLCHAASIFIVVYFAAYFASAWLQPNVDASFRLASYWQQWENLLSGQFGFRFVLATAMTIAYALWSTP